MAFYMSRHFASRTFRPERLVILKMYLHSRGGRLNSFFQGDNFLERSQTILSFTVIVTKDLFVNYSKLKNMIKINYKIQVKLDYYLIGILSLNIFQQTKNNFPQKIEVTNHTQRERERTGYTEKNDKNYQNKL